MHPDLNIYKNEYQNNLRMVDKNNVKYFEDYFSFIKDTTNFTVVNFSDYLISDISDIVVVDSTIFVLDLRSTTIHKIDLATKTSVEFIPRGRGPGDVFSPTNMVVIGDTLVVADRINGFITYTTDGTHISTTHPGYSVDYFCILNNEMYIKSLYIIQDDKPSKYLIYKLDNEFNISESYGLRYPHDNNQISAQLSMGKLICNSEFGMIINSYVYGTPVVELFMPDQNKIEALIFNDNNPLLLEIINDIPVISEINRGREIHLYSNASFIDNRFFIIQYEFRKAGNFSDTELVSYLYCLKNRSLYISKEIPIIKWASDDYLLYEKPNQNDSYILSSYSINEY
ncbi:MAG: hypothetical protein EA364_05240 [Balneolaceae bacterium]|nr:MAG: hypothetical protein EA364_05240 [Balneolaceae bacterium]